MMVEMKDVEKNGPSGIDIGCEDGVPVYWA